VRSLYFTTIIASVMAYTPAAQAAVVAVSLPAPLEITTDFLEDYFPQDIDGDGNTDFTFIGGITGSFIRTERSHRVAIEVEPPPDLGGPLTAFQAGALIGADISLPIEFRSSDHFGDGFVSDGEILAISIVNCFDFCSYTPFAAGRAYAGFEFERNGLQHYGYFDMSGAPNSRGVALYGWAWEPLPALLAVLAGGGVALLLRPPASGPAGLFMGRLSPASLAVLGKARDLSFLRPDQRQATVLTCRLLNEMPCANCCPPANF